MGSMFYGAGAFNQDLGAWDISSLNSANWMFFNSGLSTENYDGILIGWASQSLVNESVHLGAGLIQYSAAAVSARAVLTGELYWVIEDGGLLP
jgi:hypothetical protein